MQPLLLKDRAGVSLVAVNGKLGQRMWEILNQHGLCTMRQTSEMREGGQRREWKGRRPHQHHAGLSVPCRSASGFSFVDGYGSSEEGV